MYNEGKASIKYYDKAFLNPAAVLSRDISVAFVKSVAKKDTKLLDSTAATGIRGIRYCLETKAKDVTLIDMNKDAYRSMLKNIRANRIKVNAFGQSIQEFANTTHDRFDVIDFDPFGGVSTNIDDLLKIAKDGSYMLITATDTAVLCGAHAKACLRLYDAKPMHNELGHESGIRILIGYIVRLAAQFNFGVEVMLSMSYLHYFRIIIRLSHGADKALGSLGELGYAYYCSKCSDHACTKSFFPKVQKCANCGSAPETFGKMWLGNLYSKNVLKSVKANIDEKASPGSYRFVSGLEQEIDIPFYYSVPKLTRKLGVSSISPLAIIDELRRKGFAASGTHMQGSCIKTVATLREVERAARAILS